MAHYKAKVDNSTKKVKIVKKKETKAGKSWHLAGKLLTPQASFHVSNANPYYKTQRNKQNTFNIIPISGIPILKKSKMKDHKKHVNTLYFPSIQKP